MNTKIATQIQPYVRDATRAITKTVKSNDEIADLTSQLLAIIGEDPKRQGLLATPTRFSESLHLLTSGYSINTKELVADAIFDEPSGELVFIRDIEFFSLCEHHLLPFFGKVHVAYVPDGKVIGLSKIPRIIDVFSRRLQVQERLTQQIADAINNVLVPKGVSVIIEASHLCMMMRGVEKQNSTTTTKATLGVFAIDMNLRTEMLTLLNR